MNSRNLLLYTPIAQGSSKFSKNLTFNATGWRRSIRKDGGYWSGSFTLTGNKFELAQMFYEHLAFHFVEKSAGKQTFEGLVYELDLTINGITRRRTLDMMFNYLSTLYTDEDDALNTSSSVQNDGSINRFGRREEVVYLDGYPTAAAEAYRDTFLKEYQWPDAKVVGFNKYRGDGLLFTIAGYVFTTNWRFESVGDASTDDLSTWIDEIITTDCEFVDVGSIEANTVQVKKETNVPQRTFDTIVELADIGDAAANPYRFYVENDRQAHYRQIDNTPQYYLKNGLLYSSVGYNVTVNPWQVKPGVIRDMDYPAGKPNYDSWLQDARDFYVSEIEFGDDLEKPIMKTDYFEESEMLAAQEEFRQQFEEDENA